MASPASSRTRGRSDRRGWPARGRRRDRSRPGDRRSPRPAPASAAIARCRSRARTSAACRLRVRRTASAPCATDRTTARRSARLAISVAAATDLAAILAQAYVHRHRLPAAGQRAVDFRRVALRHRDGLGRRGERNGERQQCERNARDHPTAPSSETSSSFFASTANSIGNSLNTCLQKPSTIIDTASSSPMPRARQ